MKYSETNLIRVSLRFAVGCFGVGFDGGVLFAWLAIRNAISVGILLVICAMICCLLYSAIDKYWPEDDQP